RVYREALEKLGLRQLDVYRYKDHEVLRVRDPSGRVLLIRIPRLRDEMKPEEFAGVVEKLYEKALGEAKG
ncbi:MAG: hypothetical protein QI199_08115, partial [Candidatus Korarchaeota archaeon]|nr:hypothetical protein [Candidatus Korarchaeota archaeon]